MDYNLKKSSDKSQKLPWITPKKLIRLNTPSQLLGKDFALSPEGIVTTGGPTGDTTPAGPS